jgi:hypothetical protein
VVLRYLNIFFTLNQSSNVGLLFFLAALLTENVMSGLVDTAKYRRLPIALRYVVSLKLLLLKLVSSTGFVFRVGLHLVKLYFLSSSFKYPSSDVRCNHCLLFQILFHSNDEIHFSYIFDFIFFFYLILNE